MSEPEPIDPYWTKKEESLAEEYEVEERGEDEGGKYIKYKSKAKDEEGKSKHSYKMYKSEIRDSGSP